MINTPKLTGLISAPFTPMHPDGSVYYEKIKDFADYIIASKCVSGVFICGTTGESASLTTEERKNIAEMWIRHAGDSLKIIVHVGGTSVCQSEELASHAQKIGAFAIGSIAPFFFKPATVEDLVQYFRPIASAANLLPFYYYNMPSISGVSLSVPEFLKRGAQVIPTLRGVKFTHNDLMEMQQCVQMDNGEFDILHGFDEILIAGLSIGVKGAVGSTYNYIPEIYMGIMKAIQNNDIPEARRLQFESVKILDVVIRHGGGVRGGKALMKLAGVNCGQCRMPISPVSDSELDIIKNELQSTLFFNIINSRI
ncbi:MAG: dihydrodipicolinate synthase family protein [Bacteroidales bacterium]|jgi:N-acetylneuraminate lyase|nr:dihydrodipicolinate synthase family protein [Bacteroidales bacterium]MDD4479916.1 dihydrodipicolinate synthase family protein [Bacteroidales bacterium]